MRDGLANVPGTFFRYEAEHIRPHVTIYMEPLNGWGAHAIDFMRLQGQENDNRIAFQLGPSGMKEYLPDSVVVFKGNRSTLETIWHEESHVYLRQLLEQSKKQVASLERLFNASDLTGQNVKTWDYAFEENLVRAIVAANIKQRSGEKAYKSEIRTQNSRGFIYTYELAELISSKYMVDEKRYANFDSFLSEIIDLLSSKKGPQDAKQMPQ